MKAYRIRVERFCTYLKSPALLRQRMLETNPAIGDVAVRRVPCSMVALRQLLAEPQEKRRVAAQIKVAGQGQVRNWKCWERR